MNTARKTPFNLKNIYEEAGKLLLTEQKSTEQKSMEVFKKLIVIIEKTDLLPPQREAAAYFALSTAMADKNESPSLALESRINTQNFIKSAAYFCIREI